MLIVIELTVEETPYSPTLSLMPPIIAALFGLFLKAIVQAYSFHFFVSIEGKLCY